MKGLICLVFILIISPIIWGVNVIYKSSTATKIEIVKDDWRCTNSSPLIVIVKGVAVASHICNEYKRIKSD